MKGAFANTMLNAPFVSQSSG